jgi:hypothetical protein
VYALIGSPDCRAFIVHDCFGFASACGKHDRAGASYPSSVAANRSRRASGVSLKTWRQHPFATIAGKDPLQNVGRIHELVGAKAWTLTGQARVSRKNQALEA